MENYNNELLISKIKELVKLIKETKDYQKYTDLKSKMKDNNEIMSLINKIKEQKK